MNNIEILEKLQNIFKELRKDDEEGHSSAYELQWEDIEAIENLIQRNKDLKEIEKEHKEENGRLREKNINLKEKIIRQQEQLNIANKKILAQRGQLKVVNNSYIPISKLKEKMELLREDIQYSANPLSIDNSKYAIEVLEELLEEGE